MSTDKWIHDVVHGEGLVFVSVPFQRKPPLPLNLPVSNVTALDSAMAHFLEHIIVELYTPGVHGLISNMFSTNTKDGTVRIILNLKELNDHVEHIHFKLDTLKDVIPLIHPKFFFS